MFSKSALILLICTALVSLAPSQLAFAEEDTLVIESFQTVTGDLTDVDTFNKRVTFRWLADEVRLKYEDLLLDVPDTCVIVKNGETIILDDLESGDSGTVRFDSNAIPLPKASSITITE